MRHAPVNRWLILSLGLAAQTAGSAFLYGLPMLLPQLRRDDGLSLAAAGWLVAAPSFGLLATLIAWGALADRRGERKVMAAGMGLAGAFLLAAAAVPGYAAQFVFLALAGAGGASVNAASGRVVLGWFAAHERGTAMGVRQTAQPLGVALAALTLPPVANAYGVAWALVVPAVLSLVISVLILGFVVDPPRTAVVPGARDGSPYRSPTLWATARVQCAARRAAVHGLRVRLGVSRHAARLEPVERRPPGVRLSAGRCRGATTRRQVVGPRQQQARPDAAVAIAAAATMLALGLGAATGSVLAIAAIGVGTVVTVADNGLGYTAVAELAGSSWAGRALGAQNTAQNIAGSLTPPLLGALIVASGFGVGFAVVAVFPLLAILSIPVGAETALSARLRS